MSYISPFVIINVLTWNNVSDTIECLESLKKVTYSNTSIVIVDNGSTDQTVSMVRSQFPEVHIIQNNRNLGYAAGNNVGLKYALNKEADYVFLLNNDTVLTPHALSALVTDLKNNQDAAAAAPKSLYYDGSDRIYFAGGIISNDGMTIHVGIGRKDGPEFGNSKDTEWLTGCAILFRSNALREVGLFEPRFFLMFEDTDWCLRARRLGFRLRLVAESRIYHKVSRSFGKVWSPSYLYYYTRNSFLWIERSFPFRKRPRLYYFSLRHSFHIARNQSNTSPSFNRKLLYKACWQGFLDYLFRRFGPKFYSW